MNLHEARPIARGLLFAMQPHCQRCEIAGSIRRERETVKDIELVAIPTWEETADPSDLFGTATVHRSQLYHWALTGAVQGRDSGGKPVPKIEWIKPGTRAIIPWPPTEGGRYWRGWLPEHNVKVDIFLATEQNWGTILAIRTGSADFSEELVTHARRVGYRFEDGQLRAGSRTIATPDEETVFKHLGLQFVPPRERTGPEAVRPIRRRSVA